MWDTVYHFEVFKISQIYEFKIIIYFLNRAEVNCLRTKWAFDAFSCSLLDVSAKIIFFVALLSYLLLGNSITPSVVFVTLTLVNNLRSVLTIFLPLGISGVYEISVSLKRIQVNFYGLKLCWTFSPVFDLNEMEIKS